MNIHSIFAKVHVFYYNEQNAIKTTGMEILQTENFQRKLGPQVVQVWAPNA